MPESKIARADRHAARSRARIGDELRVARRAAGLTMATVAAAVDSSTSEVSRIERGLAPWVPLGTLVRLAAVVGLDLWVRTYPGGDPLRDAAHLRLQSSFRQLLGAGIRVASEVPIGDGRDQRAWDQVLRDGRKTVGVEFETRLVDAQAFVRRLHLKRRDGAVDRILVVLADTRANRNALELGRAAFGDDVAVDDRSVHEALRHGVLPDRDAVILVRSRRPR